MEKVKYDGNIENISNGSLRFINKVIIEQDIKPKKILFEPVVKAGDNFAANVKRIIVEGENKSLQLVAKFATQNEGIREIWSMNSLFLNERIIYNEVFPKLIQMQMEAGVPKADRFRYAKCYGSLTENLQETIILEDLKSSEFTMLDKLISWNDACVRSILKNMAILHSFSYVLKFREPETYESFKSRLTDVLHLMSKKYPTEMYVNSMEHTVLFLVDDEKYTNKIKSLLQNFASEMTTIPDFEYNNKSSVIIQGDTWANNFMFRFKEGQLMESIMLDYQIACNGNPVQDVMTIIFTCTDYETRSKHYYDWIDYYHTELDKALSYYNLSASKVYPRNEMDADMKRYAKYVFGLTCMTLLVTMRTGDEAAKVGDTIQNAKDYSALMEAMKIETFTGNSRAMLKKKITDVIKSFDCLGIWEN